MIKGIMFAFLAAFSWGAAIVMSKKGLENMDAGELFSGKLVVLHCYHGLFSQLAEKNSR